MGMLRLSQVLGSGRVGTCTFKTACRQAVVSYVHCMSFGVFLSDFVSISTAESHVTCQLQLCGVILSGKVLNFRVNYVPEHISSLAHILVLAIIAGAGGMVPPPSTRISVRMKYFQGHGSPVKRFITGRNATQKWFHPTRNPSTGWCTVPPAVPFLPAVPFCTKVSTG